MRSDGWTLTPGRTWLWVRTGAQGTAPRPDTHLPPATSWRKGQSVECHTRGARTHSVDALPHTLPAPIATCRLPSSAPAPSRHGPRRAVSCTWRLLRTPLSPWVPWDSPGTTEVPQNTPVPTVSPSGQPCDRRSSRGTSGSTESPARAWQVPRPPETPPLPQAPPPCPVICSVVIAWKDWLPLPVYPEVHRGFLPPPWGAPFCSGCHFRAGILMVGLDDPTK